MIGFHRSVCLRLPIFFSLAVLGTTCFGQATRQEADQAPTIPSAALAQQPTEPTPAELEQRKVVIQQRLDSLANSALPEADLRKVTEFYQQAFNALEKLSDQIAQLSKYQQKLQNYPEDLKRARTLLEEVSQPPQALDTEIAIDSLETKRGELEASMQNVREELVKAEAQPKSRSTWLAELPQKTSEIQQELEQAKTRLAEIQPEESANILTTAERAFLENKIDNLNKHLSAIEQKRRYYSMSSELVQIQRDYYAKLVTQIEKQLASVRDTIGQRRIVEAEQQAEAATEAAEVDRPAAVAKLAESNAKLAQEQAEVVASTRTLVDTLEATSKKLIAITKEYSRSKERIEASGMTEAIGQQLRQQQELLPNLRDLNRTIAQGRKKKNAASYKLYELHDRRSAAVDGDIDERMAQIIEKVPASERNNVASEVRELIEAERKILDSIIENYSSYKSRLTEVTAAESNLVNTTEEYAAFITKNVLWIRSCSLPVPADIGPTAGALAWSLQPKHWQEAGQIFWQRMQSSPVVGGFFLTGMCCLIYLQQRIRRKIRDIGLLAENRTCIDFQLSVKAVIYTFLLALPWPALMWFAGWWLDNPSNQSEFVRSLGINFQATALGLFLLELIRQVCRAKGLAESHFDWPKSCVSQLRWNTRLLLWAGLPLCLWLVGLELQNVQKLWSSTLGRVFFVTVMLLVAWSTYRMLLAQGSPFRHFVLRNKKRNTWHFSSLWIPFVVCLPLLLAGLAVAGYYYTAQRLSLRLLQTVGLALALLVTGGLTRRWILLNRRQLAREQARQKRAAEAAATGEEAPIPTELVEETVDLAALGEQTNRLLQTILFVVGIAASWFIWHEVLPALSLIGEQSLPGFTLKWGELIHFFLVVGVTYVMVGNVPALLEFVVLQHLPIDSGLRYAITSICRYVLVAVGLGLAYGALGFDSTSIQWLVAAMGVGLGFGLQEIFANFVSGIILLFERPIRVGDVVTLGEKTGQVSRIRMRATTIIDWDRKEYIVPNKDLITERLLNWTLSDQTNRITLNVGVAYGSDTDLACRLLLEAVEEHPLLLKDPAPIATFEGFGDSTLNLTLRCYLPNLEKRLPTIHDLHSAIDRKFHEAGLEIAFPQLDLHLRDVPRELRSSAKEAKAASRTNGSA